MAMLKNARVQVTHEWPYVNREGASSCFHEENSLQSVRGNSRLWRDCWSLLWLCCWVSSMLFLKCSYAIILHNNFYVRQTRQHLSNAR
jgi:hypothetical protein